MVTSEHRTSRRELLLAMTLLVCTGCPSAPSPGTIAVPVRVTAVLPNIASNQIYRVEITSNDETFEFPHPTTQTKVMSNAGYAYQGSSNWATASDAFEMVPGRHYQGSVYRVTNPGPNEEIEYIGVDSGTITFDGRDTIHANDFDPGA
jgi:hypothetical protein